MYKICVLGSGPEWFSDHDKVRRLIGKTINLLGFQYQDVVFHVRGELGVGLWAAQACLEEGLKYHLFMPFGPGDTAKYWYDDQEKDLLEQYNNAYSLTICNPLGEKHDNLYTRPIDDANFVVCFWSGERSGETEESIRYALNSSKIVLDGLNDLKLITNGDLRKK